MNKGCINHTDLLGDLYFCGTELEKVASLFVVSSLYLNFKGAVWS
jgi:hypothetical protein